jgi:hypothetical protein
MDVTGFLCVSLGSSTVQLHDSLGSRRACICSVVKGLNAKDIHTEMFPVYGGKCLLHKVVHNWVQKFSQGCSKVTDDA